MNRIDSKFRELKSKGRKAFIAYITAGDPDLGLSKRIALALEVSGADILELGIPFSDPIADGPTIQGSSQRALSGKATLKKIFVMTRSLRAVSEMPIVYMTYYNPILRYGLKNFFASCHRCGVDGVIVPDLPCEEADDLVRYARPEGIATIFLAAPTSTSERIKHIVNRSTGFIYYVSLTGVTGTRREISSDVAPSVRKIKAVTRKPVVVGFGVSNPGQAKRIAVLADGVIVGSAIVKITADKKDIVKNVSRFATSIAKAVHQSAH